MKVKTLSFLRNRLGLPRSGELLAAMTARASGKISDAELAAAQDRALRETITAMEATGSPVISAGSRRSRASRPIRWRGLSWLRNGVVIPFADGHSRHLPKLAGICD